MHHTHCKLYVFIYKKTNFLYQYENFDMIKILRTRDYYQNTNTNGVSIIYFLFYVQIIQIKKIKEKRINYFSIFMS